MGRVFSAPYFSVSKVEAHYNPGLGCKVANKADIRDALRRIMGETGHSIVEAGNEPLPETLTPALKEYDIPRGIFDNAITD